MMGEPVFKGTRLTVDHILKEMGAGMTDQELLENYPTLRPEHIRAALLYAAAVVSIRKTSGRSGFSSAGSPVPRSTATVRSREFRFQLGNHPSRHGEC
jgi:uncharacterized protein (DUF433 family)